MKKEGSYLVVAIIIALGVVALYYWGGGPTGFAISEEQQANFSQGDFFNTVLDEGKVVLDINQTSGTYTGMFDAGEEVLWNNLSIFSDEGEGSLSILICALESCGDEDFVEANLSSLNFTSQYLYYRALFERANESNLSASLESVSAGYTIPFLITVSSPEDKVYTTTEISLSASANEDVQEDGWWYVLDGSNETVFNPTNTTLSLEDETSYTLTVYANSTQGEVASKEVSFSVLIPACSNDLDYCEDQESCEAVDGYWYDGLCNEEPEVTTQETTPVQEQPVEVFTALESSDLGSVSLSSGESSAVTWTITNTGEGTLIQCLLSASGDASAWISVPDVAQNVIPGEDGEFALTVNVPGDVAAGTYAATVSIECFGISSAKDLTVNVAAVQESGEEEVAGTTATGAAIFEGIGTGGFIVLIVVVLALVFLFVASRRMRRQGKTLRDLGASIRGLFRKRVE